MYFPVYTGTLEESALDLLGAKMKAAMVFYGDDVAGALVEEEDESDILNSLLRQAMGKIQVGRTEGLFSLGVPAGAQVTHSPMGSPTAISPRIITLADLWTRRDELVGSSRRRNGYKAKADAFSDKQMTLFG